MKQTIDKSTALGNELRRITGKLDTGQYDTADMVQLRNALDRLAPAAIKLADKLRHRWPDIRLRAERLGDRILAVGHSLNWSLCRQCHEAQGLKYDKAWINVWTAEDLLESQIAYLSCSRCGKVVFTHCHRPEKPSTATGVGKAIDLVWTWDPHGSDIREDTPQYLQNKPKCLAGLLDIWKDQMNFVRQWSGAMAEASNWSGLKDMHRRRKAAATVAPMQVVKKTARYCYAENPQPHTGNKTIRLNRLELEGQGWTYSRPLKRVVYATEAGAKTFIAYFPELAKELGNASLAEIKRQYRELIKQHHPDHGGDPEKFRQIQQRFEGLL